MNNISNNVDFLITGFFLSSRVISSSNMTVGKTLIRKKATSFSCIYAIAVISFSFITSSTSRNFKSPLALSFESALEKVYKQFDITAKLFTILP